jgi:hypothetical protein
MVDRFEKKECLDQGVKLTLPNREGNITIQTNNQMPESIVFKKEEGSGPKLKIEHKLNDDFKYKEKCFQIEKTTSYLS